MPRTGRQWPQSPAAQGASQGEVREDVADDRGHQVLAGPAPQSQEEAGRGHREEKLRWMRERMRRRPERRAADDRHWRATEVFERRIERATKGDLLTYRDDDRRQGQERGEDRRRARARGRGQKQYCRQREAAEDPEGQARPSQSK